MYHHNQLLLTILADAVNGKLPLRGDELKAYVEKLLPWDEQIQECFLAEDPFECRAYTTDAKAVW